jgi:hypothetical protein
MPHVKISVNDLKCIRQADSVGRDDVYWIANLRCGTTVDPTHTALTKLYVDASYETSLPEMVPVAAGESRRFSRNVVFDKDCATGSYVYGTIHFMERDTPLANYFAKIVEIIGIIIGGLVIGAVVGFAVGYAFAGLSGATFGAIIGVATVALVGFFVGATFELLREADNDAHLGGMRIMVGPLAPPPPTSDKDTWQLTMTPAGRLEVVDEHGAELIIYESSHVHGPGTAGHRYETALQLEITGGHR